MRRPFLIRVLICTLFFINNLEARPISYAGGWTLMQKNGPTKNSFHIHYSPKHTYSVGYLTEYFHDNDALTHGLQVNGLLYRANLPDAQGNLYIQSALGIAHQNHDDEPYGFIGLSGDYETRRIFTHYQNRYYHAKHQLLPSFQENMRIGVAPYIGEFGDLHTWLMFQVNHQPGTNEANLIYTPLIRVFQGAYLGELGYASNHEWMFNWVIRF